MTQVDCNCYKCDYDFVAQADEFSLNEEGGFEIRAVCPACGAYLGHISVVLTVKE